MTHQHTPGPWIITTELISSGYDIYAQSGRLVANCGGWSDSHNPNQDAEKKANARFIVQACNSFETLLAACQAVLPAVGWAMTHQPGNMNQWRDCEAQIEAAIKKATS